MTDNSLLPFSLPSVGRKKITAAFDGGRISSDGGVMLLALAERRMGITDRLAAEITDRRGPARVVHTLSDILRARILAIACGYEDADDLDHLRSDPALKLACGRLPDSGQDLCSQPTMSSWENAPGLREVIRLMRVMVGLYCASYDRPPASVTLDVDDTLDVVHGHQQLSMFNAHYDERCFLPIHVYDTATSRPVTVPLRPGKTPSGPEIRGHLRRLLRAIREHWPRTHITIRGDSHYGRPEVMEWCDKNGIDFVFGLSGNDVLRRLVEPMADDVRVRRAEAGAAVVRRYTETRYGAKSWTADRRVAARIEATTSRSRHPLCGDQLHPRQRRVALRQPLLRPRSGREPDQAAQEPACLRPHQLPFASRQSGTSRAAHRRLLAHADSARRHSNTPAARTGGVRYLARAAAKDRRPHHRDRHARAHDLRRCLPRGRSVPQHRL
jgi:hypothetical protein